MVKLTERLVLARSRASDLDNVRKLNLWGTEITDVTILRKMPNVTIVSLSVNKISTLEDFAYCKNLEELYIRKNNISKLSEICHLKKLPKLRILWLADNPCADCENYKHCVLKALPNLQKLDNVAVTDVDVNVALEEGRDLNLSRGGDSAVAAAAIAATNGTTTVKDETDAGAEEQDENANNNGDEEEKSGEIWQETNKIRQQYGLKPLSAEKAVPPKPRMAASSAKQRNTNILQAALCLVKDLDGESLEVLSQAIQDRLDVL